MRLLLVVDNHLGRTKDGQVWSKGIYDYSFFSRYLDVFEEVNVAIRIEDIKDNIGYPNLCSGQNLKFLPIPDFHGVNGYIKNYFSVKKAINSYSKDCDCAIIRIPSAIGFQFASIIKNKIPYALEVVVDPWDFAAPGMLRSKVRPLVRLHWTNQLKKLCKHANGVSYVTQFALQKRYPNKAQIHKESLQHFQSYYSSANIKKDFFAPPKVFLPSQKAFQIIHVANTINSYVKGHKELIKAVSLLNKKGHDLSVKFVGDGELVSEFQEYAKLLRVEEKISFVGRIPDKDSMKRALAESDLFVFPTHGEGLPRVLIEAMAVGLPCISTRINGIPELLSDDLLINVGDIEELIRKIEYLISNSSLMTEVSKKMSYKAKEYSEDKLQIRRKQFYIKLKKYTESVLKEK
ncbi:glycosyltransferase [Fictibacillus fluitans]|uniref:Glycosyltransferase n=1 Tax=Fictibacillus fluitans TaxID=3058422 RepID=A0ABT8HT49_9BACL|nr:glycosyltransferase [Fictibacillus sp. NE201]MDN4523948.1 glycosyltransferase [Fictibacillus sp. NE201]